MKKLSRESRLCFHTGDMIVERRLAPRPQTARIAEPILAQLSSGQTAAALLGRCLAREQAARSNSQETYTLQKNQKDLRKSSRETSV